MIRLSTSIDAWLLGETAILRERVEAAWSEYAFRRAHQLLYDFCNDTVRRCTRWR